MITREGNVLITAKEITGQFFTIDMTGGSLPGDAGTGQLQILMWAKGKLEEAIEEEKRSMVEFNKWNEFHPKGNV